MSTKKRPGYTPEITPDYEDEIPVINKITIAPRTNIERTILLQRPKGRENRKKMAMLYPIVGKGEDLAQMVQNGGGHKQNQLFAQMIKEFWDDDSFEEVILPFVFQGCEQEYLDELEVADIVQPFMKALRFLAQRENPEEMETALKKSQGEAEAA